MAGRTPWQLAADGLLLTVRLTPKGGRDAIDGIEQMADGRSVLKARVSAVAREGEANAALVRLVARSLAISPRQVSLIAGATARLKRLKIEGSAPALARTLATIVEARHP